MAKTKAEHNAAFYAANREREKARVAAYRIANPEKVKAQALRRDKSKRAEYRKAYRLANAEKVKAARKLSYQKHRQAELAKGREYKRTHATRLSAEQSARIKADPTMNRFY